MKVCSSHAWDSTVSPSLAEPVGSNFRGTVVNLRPADLNFRPPALLPQLQAGRLYDDDQGTPSYDAGRLHNQAPLSVN